MKNPLISVIYVNFNTQELLENSLRSLVKNFTKLSYEVIVVDNKSNEFSPNAILKICKHAKIIESEKNLGFGKGNNLGAALAKGKFLWLLNTDTLIPAKNHLDDLVNFLNLNPNYGAATPLLINEKSNYQKQQISYFPSVSRMVFEKPTKLFVRIIPPSKVLFQKLNTDYLPVRERDIEVAAAASLFINHTVFNQVGGFSKEYFMYYEDTDLCRKIIEAGFKIRFFPSATTVHLLGKSIVSNYDRKQLYFHSQDQYFAQWKSSFSRGSVKVLRIPLKILYWVKKSTKK